MMSFKNCLAVLKHLQAIRKHCPTGCGGASLLLTSFKDINDNKLKVHGFATTYAISFKDKKWLFFQWCFFFLGKV